MYNLKDTQFAGRHDWDQEKAEKESGYTTWLTFSINIFPLELRSNGKSLKQGKGKVRIIASHKDKKKAFEKAEEVVGLLDSGKWDGGKTVRIK